MGTLSTQTMYRIVFLVASAAAIPVQVAPDGYGPSAVPYGPSPPSYAARPEPPRAYKVQPAYTEEEEEEKFDPQPYKYEYGVQDDYSKAAFAKSETQNEVGAVTGSYKVNLPDGRIQTVTYTADPVNGYKAVVSYEGEPVYPPEPEEGYGNGGHRRSGVRTAPAPAPAPAPLPGPEYLPREEYHLPQYIARVQ